MPQFDVSTFPSQIFWLILCFAVLCFFMVTVLAPRLGNSLESRQRTLHDLSQMADEVDAQADELSGRNVSNLTKAQQEANARIQEALLQANKYKNDEIATYENTVQSELKALNHDIAELKSSLLKEADQMVAHLSASAYENLTGKSVEEGEFLKLFKSKVNKGNKVVMEDV